MSIDFLHSLIPKNHNFQPNAIQINQLFDQLIKNNLIKSHSLPISDQQTQLNPSTLAEAYQKHFAELDQLMIQDSTRIDDTLLKKNQPNQQFCEAQIRYSIESMKPIRELCLQHLLPIQVHLSEHLHDLYLTAVWLDNAEFNDIDLMNEQALSKLKPLMEFYMSVPLHETIFSLEHPPDYVPIDQFPLFLNCPTRYLLLKAVLENSTQVILENIARVGYANCWIDMKWGIHATSTYSSEQIASLKLKQSQSLNFFRRFTYTERRTGTQNYIYPPIKWLDLPDVQLQIHLLKEIMEQEFDYYYHNTFICAV